MTITDDIVKGLRNPTPLYAVAGTADLAAEKLREVPALIVKIREQAPERIEKLRATDPKVVQERVTAQAKDAQARLNETFGELDLKELRELRDLRRLGESVQGFALQGVGRAAEYAVKARETYDELAERGKGAVAHWRGEASDEVVEIAAKVEPQREAADAKPGPARKTAPKKTTPRKPADKSAQ
jgi:polyhydroxyalkanoate synthesis regulator phasin